MQLSFENHPFSKSPKHVWIICKYNGNWLLTDHIGRGLEFPGGKVEAGETPIEAAIREVKEETGATVQSIQYIGQYKVNGKTDTIIKNVYYAEIFSVDEQMEYYETNGPVLVKKLPENIKADERFSFIMKDDVLTYSLMKINEEI